MIYFVTVNYYSAALIIQLWTSLRSQAGEYQLVIVNNSTDSQELQQIKDDNVVILATGKNLGFGGGCNLGLNWVFERDSSAIVWLINPDTVLTQNALGNAVKFCTLHSDLSIVGTLITEPNGNIWFAGGEFDPRNGRIVASQTPLGSANFVKTSWVTGCSLLLNLQNFSTCPQFDPDYFLYYEDFDFCQRYAQQGHAIVVTPQIQIIHQPSSITGRNPSLKVEHSIYSYLVALEKHTRPQVLLYRLGRILVHALRVSLVEPGKAIAIIKGVSNYGVRVRRGKFDRN